MSDQEEPDQKKSDGQQDAIPPDDAVLGGEHVHKTAHEGGAAQKLHDADADGEQALEPDVAELSDEKDGEGTMAYGQETNEMDGSGPICQAQPAYLLPDAVPAQADYFFCCPVLPYRDYRDVLNLRNFYLYSCFFAPLFLCGCFVCQDAVPAALFHADAVRLLCYHDGYLPRKSTSRLLQQQLSRIF